jgi:hypothetical protein
MPASELNVAFSPVLVLSYKQSGVLSYQRSRMRSLPALLVLTISVTSGLCNVYQQLSDLTQDIFDFVIVGG